MHFFNVRSEADFPRMEAMLARDVKISNVYSRSINKHGKSIISLGWNRNLDSDWGRYQGHAQYIFATPELCEAAEPLVEKAFGWRPRETVRE